MFRWALLLIATALVVAAPVAVAQSAAPSTGTAGPACDLIGCESGVFFDVGAYLAAHTSVERVRICALGRCRSTSRGNPTLLGQPLVLPVANERTITIAVTAFGRGGRVVLRRQLVAKLRKAQPNGPQCQPICFQTNARLSRHGVLIGRS